MAMEEGGMQLAVAMAMVGVLLWLVAVKTKKKNGRLPPGPRGLPLLGNLLLLVGKELPHRVMASLAKRYGPIVFLRLGAAPTVLVSDASLAKACLSGPNDKIFAGRPSMEATRRLEFGPNTGIAFNAYGEAWREARKLCSLQLFTARRVAEFGPYRRQEVGDLMERLKRQDDKQVDLSEAVADMVERTVFRMLLGKSPMEVKDSDMDIRAVVHRIVELLQKPMVQDLMPFLGFLDYKTKAGLDEAHQSFDILLEGLIQGWKKEETSPIILDVLLDNFNINRTKTIMMELIAAGIDTTTVTLDWAMAELMANPDAMCKLQEELEMAMVQVQDSPLRIVEESGLGKLEYLKAVVKETMRLHPPIPLLLPHMSTQACEVAGYRIPKGTQLLVNVWVIGRDPKTWPEPDKFKPERFLTHKGQLMDVHGQDFELLPFGSGRRSCPGAPIAMALVQFALANLILNFSWSLPHNHSIDLSEKFGTVVRRAKPLLAIPSFKH